MAQSLLSMLAPAPTQDGTANKASSTNATSKNDASADEKVANEFRMLLAGNAPVAKATLEAAPIDIEISTEELLTIPVPSVEDTWLQVNGEEVIAAPLEGIAEVAAIDQVEMAVAVVITHKQPVIDDTRMENIPMSAEALLAIRSGEDIMVEAPRAVLADEALPKEYLSSALVEPASIDTPKVQTAPIIQATSLEEVEQAIAQLLPTIEAKQPETSKVDAAVIATTATNAMSVLEAAQNINTAKPAQENAVMDAKQLEAIIMQRVNEGKPVPAIQLTSDGGVILPGGVELSAEEIAAYNDKGGIPAELFDVEKLVNDMVMAEANTQTSDTAEIYDTVAPVAAPIAATDAADIADADIALARVENVNTSGGAPAETASQAAAPVLQNMRQKTEGNADTVSKTNEQFDKIVANQSTPLDSANAKSNVADAMLQRTERFSQIIQQANMGVADDMLPAPQAAAPVPKATGAEVAAELSQTTDTSLMIGGEGDELSSTREARRPDFLQARQQQTPAESPIDQVKVQIKQAITSGRDEIRIRLHPMELGLVDVKMDVAADGRVNVTVLTNNRETLELLQRDAQSLADALKEAGLEADSGAMEFSMSQDGQDGSEAQAQRDSKNVTLPEEGAAAEELLEQAILAEQDWSISEGLDIKA